MKQSRTLARTIIAAGLLTCAATLPLHGQKPERLPPPPNHDVKTYHASMCRSARPYDHTTADSSGVRSTYEDEDARVDCPIMRDDATGTNGVKRAWMHVSDTDPYIDHNISCSLVSLDKWGEIIDYDSVQTEDAPGLTTLFFSVTESDEYGTYRLACDLGYYTSSYGLRLISYAVEEFQNDYDGMTDYDN